MRYYLSGLLLSWTLRDAGKDKYGCEKANVQDLEGDWLCYMMDL